jgi:hypothetical protein
MVYLPSALLIEYDSAVFEVGVLRMIVAPGNGLLSGPVTTPVNLVECWAHAFCDPGLKMQSMKTANIL